MKNWDLLLKWEIWNDLHHQQKQWPLMTSGLRNPEGVYALLHLHLFHRRWKKPTRTSKRLQSLQAGFIFHPLEENEKPSEFCTGTMRFMNDVSWWHWSANLCCPEQVPGSWRDLRAPSSWCPGSQSKVTAAWGTCGSVQLPNTPCLWTSSHFQATDSLCSVQGIVSKIPLNLKWGGCFPSAIPALGTAAPKSQSEWAISKLVTLSKNQRYTWGQIPSRWRSWKKDPTELVCAWILF